MPDLTIVATILNSTQENKCHIEMNDKWYSNIKLLSNHDLSPYMLGPCADNG